MSNDKPVIRRLLHTHPGREYHLGLDGEHVIVDRDDVEIARRAAYENEDLKNENRKLWELIEDVKTFYAGFPSVLADKVHEIRKGRAGG